MCDRDVCNTAGETCNVAIPNIMHSVEKVEDRMGFEKEEMMLMCGRREIGSKGRKGENGRREGEKEKE